MCCAFPLFLYQGRSFFICRALEKEGTTSHGLCSFLFCFRKAPLVAHSICTQYRRGRSGTRAVPSHFLNNDRSFLIGGWANMN
jgi:hypothetical protein